MKLLNFLVSVKEADMCGATLILIAILRVSLSFGYTFTRMFRSLIPVPNSQRHQRRYIRDF